MTKPRMLVTGRWEKGERREKKREKERAD